MGQNLVQLKFEDDDIAVIDTALDALESALVDLVSLLPKQRRRLTKMGDKSHAFCVKALDIAKQAPEVLPPNFSLDGFDSDMQAWAVIRPRFSRLIRLSERAADTKMALGSDIMTASLDAYALLKVAGRAEGLDQLRAEMARRFKPAPNPTKDPPGPGTGEANGSEGDAPSPDGNGT